MTFTWPIMLWALAVVPLLVGGYFLLLRRHAARAKNLPAWASAGSGRQGIRVHLPAILLLIAAIALIGALARPNAILTLPSDRGIIILAMDVSGSMKAEDMEPTRLAVAQKAAREFIELQPRSTQIGIVTFANTALLVQRPTTDREALLKQIDKLKTHEGTAIGGAIMTSLWALFPTENLGIPGDPQGDPQGDPRRDLRPLQDAAPAAPPGEEKPRPPADNTAIVLITDGESTSQRPDPQAAAKVAGERGVRIFTVGMGTTEGFVMKENGVSMRVRLDEESLQQIADTTRGRYFQASTADELRSVYRDINTRIQTETKQTEISAFFVAAAVVTGMLGAALSLLWFHRIV